MNQSELVKCIELLEIGKAGVIDMEKWSPRDLADIIVSSAHRANEVITMLKKELTLTQLKTPSAKGKYRLMDRLLRKMPSFRPILKSLHYDGDSIIWTNSYYLFDFEAAKFNFDGLLPSSEAEEGRSKYPDVSKLTNGFPTDRKWDFDLKQMKADRKLKVKFYHFETKEYGKITVELDYLINILDMFDNDVEIGFSGRVRPMYFRHNQSDSKALLLPVRINE
jgi:hypothetical protein